MAIKTKYKLIGGALLAALVFGGVSLGFKSGLIPVPAGMKAFVPEKTTTNNIVVKDTPSATYELAAEPESGFTGCPRVLSIPWNGTSALMLANGDVTTTPKSLVKQYSGGCVTLERNDDYSVMQGELLKFSQAYASGDHNTTQGAPFAIIMGDGYPAFAAGLKPQMDKIGQEAVVVGVLGFSFGEDKFMAAPAIKSDPQKARGITVAAVPRDGDQNIVIKWAADNGIPVNVDSGSYDPNAINMLDTSSFTEADDKFIAGFCEDRPVVKDGLKTKEVHKTCVDAVATWTPGDVTVVQKKGGVVTIASTKDYNQQMPTILIANKAWATEHKTFLVGLLRAVDRASYQIRTTPDGLRKASQVTAAVFGAGGGEESDPAYWAKYFVGYDETDSAGNKVNLGGSRVVGLSEVSDFLGLTTGSYNVYKGVYNTFGKYNTTMYPKEVASVPDYDSVVDSSFVKAAFAGVKVTNTTPTTTSGPKNITNVVSQQNIVIEFETGSARISAKSQATLYNLADNTAMTNLLIRIDGHTDNTGDPEANQALSRQRAQAIADWLYEQAPNVFSKDRVKVRGYGDTDPVADNTTAAGRAANRRVVITLGN